MRTVGHHSCSNSCFSGPKSCSNVLPSIVPRPLLEDKFSPLINRCSCFANSDTLMTPGFKNYFEAVLIEPFANKAQSCPSKSSQLPIIRKTPLMNSARPKEKKSRSNSLLLKHGTQSNVLVMPVLFH